MAIINGVTPSDNDDFILCDNQDDFVNALGGNDLVNGAAGNDSLFGGLGNDTLYISDYSSADSLDGGNGDDFVAIDDSTGNSLTISYTNPIGGNIQNAEQIGINVGSGDDNINISALSGATFNDPNFVFAGAGNDAVVGSSGSDNLSGDMGNDSLFGGMGNDTLYVSDYNSADSLDGGDSDDFLAISDLTGNNLTISYTNLTGDNIQNVEGVEINTGSGNDNINISALSGAPFNNSNYVSTGAGNDFVVGGSSNDIIVGDFGDDHLEGRAGKDTLNGGTSDDFLSRGDGLDTLIGGTDDDLYVIDSTTDLITENLGEGTDTVVSIANFNLTTNVENLYLYDTAVSGTGNSSDNFIVASTSSTALSLNGSGGNDFLFGGIASDTINGDVGNDLLFGDAGNDQLIGGAGDDLYVVDSSSDTVTENLGEGTDTVIVTANFTLSDNVENLFLYNGATVGTGNSTVNVVAGNESAGSFLSGAGSSDFLYGGSRNDTLVGGEGNDIITGDAGNDQFVFGGSGVNFSNIGVDTIVDFSSGDQIILSLATFALSGTPGSPLSGGDFATVVTDLEAQNSAALIVYNSSTGNLFYNQDRNSGSGFGTGGQFATLLRTPALEPTSFLIVG